MQSPHVPLMHLDGWRPVPGVPELLVEGVEQKTERTGGENWGWAELQF